MVGTWKAERGIHPGSRNDLLIFFKKGDFPQQDGGIRGLHSQFLTLAEPRAPRGGIRHNPEWASDSKTPPGANKKTYKTYWCFPV